MKNQDNQLYDKFISANEVNDWDVLTPKGWINIEGIGKTILYEEWVICTETGKILICADTHLLGRCDNLDFENKKYDFTEIYVKDIKINDYVMTKDGPEKIVFNHVNGKTSNMYDLQISTGSDKHYYTNDFVSHNSLWMQNFAVNAANAGYNVAVVSMELSDKKCMKRIGSMRLEIPISEYTEKTKDKEYIKDRIAEMNRRNGDGVFEAKPGKLYVREFPSGTATLSDIRKYLKQIKEEAGIEIDILVIDYIQIMGCEKGVDRNMLYLKGEHLAVGLRAIAQQHNLVCLSATQLVKDKYGSNNIELNDMPESKAIADTADTVWGIILTALMKAEGKYHLKHVKLRDNATDYERVGFLFNKSYLRLHSDFFIESTLTDNKK